MTSFEAFVAYLTTKIVTSRLNGVQPLEAAVPTTTFDDLGFDSLHVIEATMVAEDLFGIEVSDREMERCSTLGEFYDLCVQLATPNVA